MDEENASSEAMHLTKSRLESLSDGIFAFAMTLLVLGLTLPDKSAIILTNTYAVNLLVSLYSSFYHYVLAFLILGTFWLTHHIEVHPLKSMNRIYVWLNLSTLLFVAMLPFSTLFIGAFPNVPVGSIVFEFNLFAIGMGMYLQWWYASRNHHLIEPELTDRFIRHVGNNALIVPCISIFGILLALAGLTYSTAVYLLIPVLKYLVVRIEIRDSGVPV